MLNRINFRGTIKLLRTDWAEFLSDKLTHDMIHLENVYEDDFLATESCIQSLSRILRINETSFVQFFSDTSGDVRADSLQPSILL